MPSVPPAHYSTMIQGDVVNIRDATLNMPIRQVNEFGNRDKPALDLLRSSCSLAALVDASQRYDPPRCAEATRRDIIRKLEDWIRHDHSPCSPPSSIFWLYGGAGAGKSALAQSLAERFKANEDLAASFFFFKTDVKRNNGNYLIPTLVLQLAQSFQGLTPIVEEIILQYPDLLTKRGQTQILSLLIEPLIKLSVKETNDIPVQSNAALKAHPRLVVIDGLDECVDQNVQCDLLRIIASAIPHFPYPLRFLITSRPESHIARAFQHDLDKVTKYDLSGDFDADNDIRTFLNAEFAKIRRTHPLSQHLPSQWPHPAGISSIVERSSAHFIYASTVIRFIQSPKHRPDDRLQVILGLKQPYRKEQPYAALDSLYTLIFLEIEDSSQLVEIHRALGIMHLRSTKMGIFARVARWTSDRHAIEELLELRPGDLALLFDSLLSLVTFDKDNIRILHKSLFDYLLDSSRSGDFRLDLGLANETTANHILQRRKSKDSWDVAEFQDFIYHCRFACLNDTLKFHLRSLAYDPKFTFSESSLPLRWILYFLQDIGRQNVDSSGNCYRKYIRRMNWCLRSAVLPKQQLECMNFWFTRPDLVLKFVPLERNLRSSLGRFFKLKGHHWTGFKRRITIPATNMSVIKSIKHEHELFSSYVKLCRPFSIVVSFLEQRSGFIHSCHFVIGGSVSVIWVAFVMLVTYTEYGVQLFCSAFERPVSLLNGSSPEIALNSLVEKHFRNTQKGANNYPELFRT